MHGVQTAWSQANTGKNVRRPTLAFIAVVKIQGALPSIQYPATSYPQVVAGQ